MKVLKSILSAMHSLQFQPDQAAILTNKERSHKYYLHTPPLERGRQRNCDYQKTRTHFYLLQPTIPPLRGICKELAPKSLFLTCREELGGSNIQNTSYEGLSFFSIIARIIIIIISIFHVQKQHTKKKHSYLDGLHTNPAKHFVFGY
jgi:hypothetical protein